MNKEKIINYLKQKAKDLSPFIERPAIPNPSFEVPQVSEDQFLNTIYSGILGREGDEAGLAYWASEIKKGTPKENIIQHFRKVAVETIQKDRQKTFKFEDLLNPGDKGRVLYVMPESLGDIFLSTALFKSIKNRYPEWTFYVATKPEYKSILDGNPYVDKWIEYSPMMDSLIWLEGNNSHPGYFNVAYQPHLQTQRNINHTHNNEDIIDELN